MGKDTVCLWRLQSFSRGWPKTPDQLPKAGTSCQSLHFALEREGSSSLTVLSEHDSVEHFQKKMFYHLLLPLNKLVCCWF